MARGIAAALGLAVLGACAPQSEGAGRFPVSSDYPDGVMERFSFPAGGGEAWRLSALRTPHAQAPWRVVVVSGTPSWSEYWAPVLAAAPGEWEVVVVDRPGFADSQPHAAVPSLRAQADALSPLLNVAPGRRVILVGQSYGAPIAALMAARDPGAVAGLVVVSSFFGEKGPTARRLFGLGSVLRGALPRDLRNAVVEVGAQPAQLPEAFAALEGLAIPIEVIHGGQDTFVAPAAALRLAQRLEGRANLRIAPDGDHFLNACCVAEISAAIQRAMDRAAPDPDGPQSTASR